MADGRMYTPSARCKRIWLMEEIQTKTVTTSYDEDALRVPEYKMHVYRLIKVVGFARFVLGPGEAFGERAGEALDGAAGDTGPRFDFGLGETAGERGGAVVEDEAGSPRRISLM